MRLSHLALVPITNVDQHAYIHSRPHVHKETENEDQAQDQIDKLPKLAQKLLKFVEICTAYLGGQD